MKQHIRPSYSPWYFLPTLLGGATLFYLLSPIRPDALPNQSYHSSVDGVVYDSSRCKLLFISDVDGDGIVDVLHFDNHPFWVAHRNQFSELDSSIPVMPSDLRDAATHTLRADQDLVRLLEKYRSCQQTLSSK